MLTTRHKILLARTMSTVVLALRRLVRLPHRTTARRRGITWSLDLREGIDFAIWLLGGFEVRTLERYEALVRPGDTVLDIGANVGAHTLPLARLVGPSGRVIAFEPTAWAFDKQRTNVSLNPELAPRIDSRQVMLVAQDDAGLPGGVYSSWPLERADDLHDEHHGRLMSTEGARATTLDAFLAEQGITRVDFVKLDVDGNEADVLRGATRLLEHSRPVLMLELAPYVHRDDPGEFDALLALLARNGYRLSEGAGGRELPADAAGLRARIPDGGGLNVLASVRR